MCVHIDRWINNAYYLRCLGHCYSLGYVYICPAIVVVASRSFGYFFCFFSAVCACVLTRITSNCVVWCVCPQSVNISSLSTIYLYTSLSISWSSIPSCRALPRFPGACLSCFVCRAAVDVPCVGVRSSECALFACALSVSSRV